MSGINVLIVGAGPAGLAAALRLKQRLNKAGRDESVVVLEKASRLGYHTLSGAVFEADCLDELTPGWRESNDPFVKSMVKVERDDLLYLTSKNAYQIPRFAIPSGMRHDKDYTMSLGRMVEWLGRLAEKEGVEIHTGFAGGSLLMDGGEVRGVKLVDLGLDQEGKPKPNYMAGEEILADVTVFGDGARGVISRQFIEKIGDGRNPQVYSLGVKQLIKLPPGHAFGNNRAIHTIGYPNRPGVFGGSFMYSMGGDVVAIGLILGLDWKYQDLNPQQELELLKTHPFVRNLLQDGQVLVSGVKTIPEGGYYALPELYADRGLLLGDAAGVVNMKKIKGVHYAIRSGMCAADAIFESIQKGDYSRNALRQYRNNLEERGMLSELRKARNFRQAFKFGLYVGAPLSLMQALIPGRLGMHKDYQAMRQGAKIEREPGVGMDKAQFVSFSGTGHREDEPAHVKIKDAAICVECSQTYGNPCIYFCPGEVFRMKGEEMILSASNCLHDGSCEVKCPLQNVKWTPPEGGEGPHFKRM